MIDAEDLATGNYEDDQTILQMISNKMKQSKDKMIEIVHIMQNMYLYMNA